MSSTISLVIPRVEQESVFLQLVVQTAIRAHRDGSLVTVNSRRNIQRSPKNNSLTVIEVNAEGRSMTANRHD
jgi:hypothetical protein